MPELGLSTEEENRLNEERQKARYRKVRDAFLKTFGPPGARTPLGTVMLEELERFCNYRKLIRELDTTGQTDIYRTGIKEGRREAMQAIHDLIEWRETPHVNPSIPSP